MTKDEEKEKIKYRKNKVVKRNGTKKRKSRSVWKSERTERKEVERNEKKLLD